jgi:hypothetical protein
MFSGRVSLDRYGIWQLAAAMLVYRRSCLVDRFKVFTRYGMSACAERFCESSQRSAAACAEGALTPPRHVPVRRAPPEPRR